MTTVSRIVKALWCSPMKQSKGSDVRVLHGYSQYLIGKIPVIKEIWEALLSIHMIWATLWFVVWLCTFSLYLCTPLFCLYIEFMFALCPWLKKTQMSHQKFMGSNTFSKWKKTLKKNQIWFDLICTFITFMCNNKLPDVENSSSDAPRKKRSKHSDNFYQYQNMSIWSLSR